MDLSEKSLWNGVINRDRRYHGICYYGVISTGIYCRFHCPTKRPLRENTRFFFSKEGAEKAGFRACKRCHPEWEEGMSIDSVTSKVITVCRYIESREYIPTLEELSEQTSLSPFHLQRVFKKAMGISPRNYADTHRQSRLKRALYAGDDIALATYEAGYGASSRLYEKSSHYFGMTPKAYKQRGKGEAIHYSVLTCPLGLILLATTERRFCAVRIGDEKRALVAELKNEFRNASIKETDSDLSEWTQMLINYISGSTPWPKLPYDVRATAFQRKVWDHLRTVPEGEKVHYGEIAAAIGRPQAARAVARACASNPVAIVIPCHRVVPKSGGVGGYRWGSERKTKLLNMEKKKTKG